MGKGRKESSEESDDFSEEERQMRKRDPKNQDDPRNKLKLGEFHRNNIKKKQRKPSLKKKLRDALRMA